MSERRPGARVAQGALLALALHFVFQPLLAAATGGRAFLLLGASQLVYQLPLILIFCGTKRPDHAKGVAIVLCATILINVTCFVVVVSSLHSYYR